MRFFFASPPPPPALFFNKDVHRGGLFADDGVHEGMESRGGGMGAVERDARRGYNWRAHNRCRGTGEMTEFLRNSREEVEEKGKEGI